MDNQIITADDLEQLGVTSTNELVDYLNETLEERVGTEITEVLSDEQLEHLITLHQTASAEDVAQWLNKNIADLAEIRQDNVDILLGEIVENTEGLNTSNDA